MRPYALWALALFAFSIPSENGVTIAGIGSLSRLIGILTFGLGILSLYHGGRVRFRPPSLFIVVTAIFVLWSATTYFWSIAPSVTISRVVTFAQLAMIVWLVHQLAQTERERATIAQAFVLGCYVVIATAIVTFGSAAEFRNVGNFNPNGLAIVSALAIPMAWTLTLRPVFRGLTVLNAVYPLFALAAVVLAASRGGLVTALIALLIIPVTLARSGGLRRIVLTVFVVGSSTAAFFLVSNRSPNLQQNFERLGEADEQLLEGTLTGRTRIWRAGIDVLLREPLIGVGAGAFGLAVVETLGQARAPHNAFIAVAVESGFIGLSMFVFLFVLVYVGIMSNPVRRGEHLVLFLALTAAMMPTNAHSDKFAWFILAMLASSRPIQIVVNTEDEVRPRRFADPSMQRPVALMAPVASEERKS